MSAWVPFTVDEFRNDLPVDFLSQYDAWVLANSGKAARMAEIVASTVIPEGFYIWDAGDKTPAAGGK